MGQQDSLHRNLIQNVLIFSIKIGQIKSSLINQEPGPWWWSSGQRSCLLLQWCEFKSRWLLKFSVQREENKWKTGRCWPIFKKINPEPTSLCSFFIWDPNLNVTGKEIEEDVQPDSIWTLAFGISGQCSATWATTIASSTSNLEKMSLTFYFAQPDL